MTDEELWSECFDPQPDPTPWPVLCDRVAERWALYAEQRRAALDQIKTTLSNLHRETA